MIGRILIVENEARWQERLMTALRTEGYEVHLATSLKEARRLLHQVKPDVLTLDMELTPYRMEGYALLQDLDTMPNSPEVILVSGQINRFDIQKLWRGYDIFYILLKENYGTGRYFLQTVRDAVEAKRRTDCEEDVIETRNELSRSSDVNTLSPLTEAESAVLQDVPCPLTEAEKAVMREVARGKPNKVIAKNRDTALNTIKTQLRSIFDKLGATNRIEAIRAARKLGCIPSDDDDLM